MSDNRPLHGFRRHLGCGAVTAKTTANVWEILQLYFIILVMRPHSLQVLQSIDRTAREISSLVVCHRSLHKTIVNSPLTAGFFQKIASTHRSSLMMPVWGLLKWKRAWKNTYKKRTNNALTAYFGILDLREKDLTNSSSVKTPSILLAFQICYKAKRMYNFFVIWKF